MGMESLLRSILRLFKAKSRGPNLLDLQDDLLREILLRIGFPGDLIRASAACVSFRRLVTEPSFFRRYRSTHPPLLLGFPYPGGKGFQPAEAPHPNAPAARALDRAANFSFADRLPRLHHGCHWLTCDLRDGRILLKSQVRVSCRRVFFLNLAVCDPLSGQYLLLPLIPNNLLASFQLQQYDVSCFEDFLVPSTEEEKEDETSFRVIGVTMTDCKLLVFVFSSSSGCWSLGTSTNWDALNLPPNIDMLERPHYVHGCFFWKVYKDKLLKLDMGIMELSTQDLPPGHHHRFIAVAEAGEGKLALFSHYSYDDTFVDYYTTQNNCERDNKWQMMNTIPLPANHQYHICGAAAGYIFIMGFPKVRGPPVRAVCLSLEVKSLKIERVCSVMRLNCDLQPYFGYPPPMSPRVIQSGYESHPRS